MDLPPVPFPAVKSPPGQQEEEYCCSWRSKSCGLLVWRTEAFKTAVLYRCALTLNHEALDYPARGLFSRCIHPIFTDCACVARTFSHRPVEGGAFIPETHFVRAQGSEILGRLGYLVGCRQECHRGHQFPGQGSRTVSLEGCSGYSAHHTAL